MKKLLALFFILGITACSNMQDMRNRAADNEFQSNKQVKEVANCILQGWQNKSQTYGTVFIQPITNGESVFSAGQLELADIIKQNDKTIVKFYHQGGLFSYRINNRLYEINSCI